MSIIKKLSIATVCGKPDLKKIINSSEPIPLMRVLGQAVGTRAGTSSYGDWTSLIGQFKCTNIETGEVFEGATLFLPDVALVPLQVALGNADARGVAFALDVLVKATTNSKPGGSPYEYTFNHVLPPADSDPIRMLEQAIAEQAAAIADQSGGTKGDAPAPTAAPAAAPASAGRNKR